MISPRAVKTSCNSGAHHGGGRHGLVRRSVRHPQPRVLLGVAGLLSRGHPSLGALPCRGVLLGRLPSAGHPGVHVRLGERATRGRETLRRARQQEESRQSEAPHPPLRGHLRRHPAADVCNSLRASSAESSFPRCKSCAGRNFQQGQETSAGEPSRRRQGIHEHPGIPLSATRRNFFGKSRSFQNGTLGRRCCRRSRCLHAGEPLGAACPAAHAASTAAHTARTAAALLAAAAPRRAPRRLRCGRVASAGSRAAWQGASVRSRRRRRCRARGAPGGLRRSDGDRLHTRPSLAGARGRRTECRRRRREAVCHTGFGPRTGRPQRQVCYSRA